MTAIADIKAVYDIVRWAGRPSQQQLVCAPKSTQLQGLFGVCLPKGFSPAATATTKRRGPHPKPGPDKAALDLVRAEFAESGITITGWAKANGFSRMTVVSVMLGRLAGHHGEAHRVCIALGLKKGHVAKVANFKPAQVAA